MSKISATGSRRNRIPPASQRGSGLTAGGPGPAAAPLPRAGRLRLYALLIAAAVLAAYLPVRDYTFVSYDDYDYVLENPRVTGGLRAAAVAWAFTTFHASNWHPLSWLSHMSDATLFGLNAGGHHLMSVGWHLATVLVLLVALARLTGRTGLSALVAGLVALHPLNVECVAWIAERKSVLCALLWAAAMLAWAWYVSARSRGRYFVVALLVALALLAKPMAVTLPLALLLLDVWPLGRWKFDAPDRARRGLLLVREKLPLLALSLATGIATVAAQRAGGSVAALTQLSLADRIANALVSYVRYLGKAVWPRPLAVFYPREDITLTSPVVIGSALVLAAVTAVCVRQFRARPYLAIGWFWYLGTMVPVIGLVQVGSQSLADRYAYLPLVGFFLALAWLLADTVVARPALRRGAAVLAVVWLMVLAAATHGQVAVWRDSITLFRHAQHVTQRNAVAAMYLGVAYARERRYPEAVTELRQALEISPGLADAHANLGSVLLNSGDLTQALPHLRRAVEIRPGSAAAHKGLGVALLRGRDPQGALEHLRQAVRLDANDTGARINLAALLLQCGETAEGEGLLAAVIDEDPASAAVRRRVSAALLDAGRLAEAAQHAEAALRLQPDQAEVLNTLGVVRMRQGDLATAIRHYRQALRLEPGRAPARRNLGIALQRQGQAGEARRELEEALRLQPADAEAQLTLGTIAAQSGNLPVAIEHFRAAVSSDPDNAVARTNIGAALIQAGRIDEAIVDLRRAIAIDPRLADAQSNLGVALLQRGDRAGAGAAFSAALRADPTHANARAGLAQATAGGATAARPVAR